MLRLSVGVTYQPVEKHIGALAVASTQCVEVRFWVLTAITAVILKVVLVVCRDDVAHCISTFLECLLRKDLAGPEEGAEAAVEAGLDKGDTLCQCDDTLGRGWFLHLD